MEADSWDAQMALMDQWSDAGGMSNKRIALPFLRKAQRMEKRLRAARIPHPLES
jgi:hypothetical protein